VPFFGYNEIVSEQNWFQYGAKELDYLSKNDERLGWAIKQIGFIKRAIEPDFFSSITRSIIGQQISTAAQRSVFNKLLLTVGTLNPKNVLALSTEQLQSVGMTSRKAIYIQEIAQKMESSELNPALFDSMSDQEVITALVALKGVGVWTAEMLLIFSLQRPNIVSWGDLAIVRGMRMLYQKEKITKQEFETITAAYSPYGSIASLYLWAVAGKKIEGLSDPAPPKKKRT